MGAIAEMLSAVELPDQGLCSDRLAVEACESIHVHYRDLRIEFTPSEFATFAGAQSEARKRWAEKGLSCPTEEFHELARLELAVPAHAPTLLTVELLRDDTLHVHYRNIRLEMSAETAACFAQALLNAYSRSVTRYSSEASPAHQVTTAHIAIEEINPFDQGHRREPTSLSGFECRNRAETEEHERGIRLCMSLMSAGYEFLPIAVTPVAERDTEYSGPVEARHRYQRLDGFKRYEAMRRLGVTQCLCHIYSEPGAVAGVQRYCPWVIGRRQV